jgi:uncharacterized integral membrane protein (TIGR00698 family)
MTTPRAAPRPRLVPGLALAVTVVLVSLGIAMLEEKLFGRAVIDALVVAILLGMLLRSAWSAPPSIEPGIAFAAKEVLEVAVLLLGASVDLPLLLQAGPALAVGIVSLVTLGLALTYGIGRAMRLPHRLAVLVACGNAICGNSAIAAVAPVIRAEREHVASAIAFTAILGVAVVVGLPLLIGPLRLGDYEYGVLAGLTVYAVPQVLAATFPVSVLSGQVGTLVKLVRVLMLGPVVLFFALTHREPRSDSSRTRPALHLTRFVPWFIVGFLLLAALRSGRLIPVGVADILKAVSGGLTLVAMAGLGLGVDLRDVRRVGAPVALTVTLSLLALVGLAYGLIRVLAIR